MSTNQDFRVSIIVNEPTPPVPSKGGKLLFVGKPFTPGDLEIRTIATENDITTYISVADAKEIYWTDTAFTFVPYTDISDLQSQIELAEGKGSTLIVSSVATSVTTGYDLVFNGLVVYTSDSLTAWDDAGLVSAALKPKTCIFLDPELEGKPFFTFISTISTFPVIGGFIGLLNPSFSSTFDSIAKKNLIVDNSFSAWVQGTESAYAECNDVYASGKQAQVFYQYLAVEDVVKNVVDNFVKRNMPYTDASLRVLDSSIAKQMGKLVDQIIIDGFQIIAPTIASQTITAKVKGQIFGYVLTFDESYRIAHISLTIEGVL